MLRICGGLFLMGSLLFIAGWNLGWIVSDRWTWSQWLSWIPALALAPVGLLLIASVSITFRRNIGWQAGLPLLLAGPTMFLVGNWRPGQDGSDDGGITITHWTLGSVLSDEDVYASTLLARLTTQYHRRRPQDPMDTTREGLAWSGEFLAIDGNLQHHHTTADEPTSASRMGRRDPCRQTRDTWARIRPATASDPARRSAF